MALSHVCVLQSYPTRLDNCIVHTISDTSNRNTEYCQSTDTIHLIN